MPRRPRVLQGDYPYHVSTRTAGKIFVFKKWTYKIIIEVLVEAIKRYNVDIHHFKMMHTHYHSIVSTAKSNLSGFQWYINHTISRRLNKRMGRNGHLWGKRYDATVIENEGYLARCTRYLYQNGVRAGICKRASEDDQLSTFEFYARGKKIEFAVVGDCVYMLTGNTDRERQEYFLATMDEPLGTEEIDAIRNGLRKVFYGSADFMEKMKLKYFGKPEKTAL